MTGTIYFEAKNGEPSPRAEAETFIRNNGWSIGSSCMGGKRGVIFEPDVLIAKWRNLTLRERETVDAVLEGSYDEPRVLRMVSPRSLQMLGQALYGNCPKPVLADVDADWGVPAQADWHPPANTPVSVEAPTIPATQGDEQ